MQTRDDRNRRLARLLTLTASLSAARTPAEVAQSVFSEGLGLLGASSGAIVWVTEPGVVEIVNDFGYPELLEPWRRQPLEADIPVAAAIREGRPVWLESLDEVRERYPHLVEFLERGGEQALFALPLIVEGSASGSLALGFREPRHASEEERQFISTVGNLCAQAYARAMLFEAERRAHTEAQAAMRVKDEAYAILDSIYASAPIGLGFFDRGPRFVRLNEKLAEINGLPVAAHLGRKPSEVLPELDGIERIEEEFRQVMERGVPRLNVEVTGVTPSAPGERRIWLENWHPVRLGGETIGMGVVVREVTEERHAQEFQQHILGIVSHDLRNPLAAVLTSAALLQRRGTLGERDLAVLRRIESGARRMERIVAALLDYASLRAGESMAIRPVETDLDAILEPLLDEARTNQPARTIDYRPGEDGTGEWDPDRIAQVASNLLSNALKYSPADTPVVLTWRGEGDEVVVEVMNQGPPIPEEMQAFIFEPFARAPSDAERKPRGVGLGLFIASRIASAHGGSISVRSSGAEGTVFTLRLPRWPR